MRPPDINRSTYYLNVKSEVKLITSWLGANNLCLNGYKTKIMIFDGETDLDQINVTVNNSTSITIKVEEVRSKKYSI